MTYTAHSPNGPRVALATSKDLFHWQRLGLATFSPYRGIEFQGVDNKDASVFPVAIPSRSGRPALAILHRPLFPGTRPEETVRKRPARMVDLHRESIWISYCPLEPGREELRACHFESHHRLVAPVERWERLKIGGGTPPVLTRYGWLIIYHGVSKRASAPNEESRLCYSAGALILSREQPRMVRYRSKQPVLAPEQPEEIEGIVPHVVFPTGIDRRDDLGTGDLFDIYYGMADSRIGAARIKLPRRLP
jgi:predicted GH43/DUF377 family glycosyl hydrolase